MTALRKRLQRSSLAGCSDAWLRRKYRESEDWCEKFDVPHAKNRREELGARPFWATRNSDIRFELGPRHNRNPLRTATSPQHGTSETDIPDLRLSDTTDRPPRIRISQRCIGAGQYIGAVLTRADEVQVGVHGAVW